MNAVSGLMGSIRAGGILVVLVRFDHWQLGFIFPKGQVCQLLQSRQVLVRPIVQKRTRPQIHTHRFIVSDHEKYPKDSPLAYSDSSHNMIRDR
jgi:hypothetical protein